MIELWKPVLGFEGRYEVSDHGRVRSLGVWTGAKNGGRAFRRGRVLTLVRKNNGYMQVSLVDVERKKHSKQVHQLVCEAFIGPPPRLCSQVCHWDGERSNNRLNNLRYGTAVDNAADRARHGRFVCNLPGLEWCSS